MVALHRKVSGLRNSLYWWEYFKASRAPHIWERLHFKKFYPSQPSLIYKAIEAAGFPSEAYRSRWPDLIEALPSAALSPPHFVEFADHEVTAIRYFPFILDFDRLQDITQFEVRYRPHLASIVRSLIQAQINHSIDCVRSVTFWTKALSVLSRVGAPIIVVGDSHTLVMRQTIAHGTSAILPINLLCGGGSAVGLSNLNSRSGYGALVRGAMAAIEAAKTELGLHTPIFFTFGQVDVEFVFTFRRLREREFAHDAERFDIFCKDVAQTYVGWLASLKSRDIVVVGINPPCIDDNFITEAYRAQMQVYLKGGAADVKEGDSFETLVPNFDQLRFPSKAIRTVGHRLYNAHLQTETASVAIDYIDTFDRMLGLDGCISPQYACASDGSALQIGATGKDIHVGGQFALAVKADMIQAYMERALRL